MIEAVDTYVNSIVSSLIRGDDVPIHEAGRRGLENLLIGKVFPDLPAVAVSLLATALFGESVSIRGPGRYSNVHIYRIRECSDGGPQIYHSANGKDFRYDYNKVGLFADWPQKEYREYCILNTIISGTPNDQYTFAALQKLGVPWRAAWAYVFEHGADKRITKKALGWCWD